MYLKQVLDHYPKSASTYIELWRHKDKNNKVVMSNEECRNMFLISPTKFRNDLLCLVREGLISVFEKGFKMTIEIVNFDEE
jgi:hypothetical protein